MRRSAQREDDKREIDERPNSHNQLIYLIKKVPNPVADRDSLLRVVWREDSEGRFVLVTSPAVSANRPITANIVRAEFPSALRFVRKNDVETTVEFVARPYVGHIVQGPLQRFLLSRFLTKSLGRMTLIQEFFQGLRGLEEWDADDGRAVGEVMCIKTKEEKHREKGESKVAARMRELFKKQKGLRQIAEKYEFFQPMITRVVENKLRTAATVNTPLCDVSKKEGRAMARGLAMAMASSLTAEAGVDIWILTHKALIQFDKEEAWFRPLINIVGKRLLGEVSWGLKTRVVMGAGLSILDMATDIFVIMGYMGKDDTKGYGWSLLWMIVASIVFQVVLVYFQHRKAPLKLLREVLIVLTGLKPGVDAFNVVSGKEEDVHSVVDAKIELVVCKAIEMVCESIPGTILQLYAILKSGERSRRAIVSIAVSALTTGFGSATMSFDFDGKKRRMSQCTRNCSALTLLSGPAEAEGVARLLRLHSRRREADGDFRLHGDQQRAAVADAELECGDADAGADEVLLVVLGWGYGAVLAAEGVEGGLLLLGPYRRRAWSGCGSDG